VACITDFNFTIQSELQDISTIGQLNRDDNYRKFEPTFKRWSMSINSLYIEDDEGQERMRQAIDNDERLWLKIIPRNIPSAGGLVRVWVGNGLVTSITHGNGLQSVVGQGVQIIGTGPLESLREDVTNPIQCSNICCVELNESVFLYDGQTFEAPPAPEGSTGFIVEKFFEPVETGTGDIGTISLNATGAGLSGCPVQVVYRYLCDDSPFVPDTGNPPNEQFQEIGEKTTNTQQLGIIKILEKETGKTVSDTFSYEDLWIEFNFVFLPANPDFILDLSQFGLTDTFIIATLTELKGLNIDFNNLSTPDLETIADLELVHFSANHNLFGQFDASLQAFADTIKHLDISFNFFTEAHAFGAIVGSGSVTLDLYDSSFNIWSFYLRDKLKSKIMRVNNNTYPNDAALGNGFWENMKGDPNIITQIAVQFPQLCENFSILEELDISANELIPSDDISLLIAQVAADLSITVAQATPIVKYDPTFTSTLPIDVFDFLTLVRNWLDA